MHSQEMKYLGYGLGIGALVATTFLAVVFLVSGNNTNLRLVSSGLSSNGPTSTVTYMPANTSVPTSTSVPYTTPIPLPSPTLSIAEWMIGSGEITLAGPLTKQQQIDLYEASLFFVAPTYNESKKISVLVNSARFSDPSTTCGPLSIAILQRAGVLGGHIIPHDFFLLNPDLAPDREIIAATFPEELYSDTRYKVKLNKFDWVAEPLIPGDFVYIYMGTGGNFEHMLVVNRVDYQGRAYSVTNYNTELGFIIDEVMLYDPKDPTAGIFTQWTQRENQLLGSTGFAGFEVWRLRE